MTRKLFFRTGGTARFAWHETLVPAEQFPIEIARLTRMGYATVVAVAAPTTFVPTVAEAAGLERWRERLEDAATDMID